MKYPRSEKYKIERHYIPTEVGKDLYGKNIHII